MALFGPNNEQISIDQAGIAVDLDKSHLVIPLKEYLIYNTDYRLVVAYYGFMQRAEEFKPGVVRSEYVDGDGELRCDMVYVHT